MKEKDKYSIKETKELFKSETPNFVKYAEINFDNTTFTVDLSEEMLIDENNLVDSMVKHSGKYGWWTGMYTTSKRKMRKLKRERDKQCAELDMPARADLIKDKIKVTEAAVKAYKDTDPRIISKEKDIEALEDLVEYSEAVLRALEHKRDMLKEINRNVCNEAFNIRQ